MKEAFRVERTIHRPVDEVWAGLTNWSEAARWMSGIDRLEAGGDTTVGTTLTFYTRGRDRTATIAECEPGQILSLRSVQGRVTADYTYTLEAKEDATVVRLVATCELRGWFGLLGPIVRLAMAQADRGQLDQLATHLER